MTDVRATWDPAQYERFAAERERPARELLARLPTGFSPRQIWDLGCGPGRQALGLKSRYREARVHGLDSSAAMLEEARASGAEIDWREGDIGRWRPEAPADLILANASLQWLGDHPAVFPRLVRALAPGGVLAVQMPLAAESPRHGILGEVARQGPWAERLAGVARMSPLLSTEAYYDLLAADCGSVDIWTTTYLHALTGADAVLEWMKGTALRPYLGALDEPAMRAAFLAALGERLAAAYPRRSDGVTLLPFPRLFLIARRRGGEGR